jgi:hypothetical protein
MAVSLTGVKRAVLVALATALTFSVTGPAQASGSGNFFPWPSPPPPDRIIIDVVTVNGSGCRPNTAAVAVSPDNTAFTVTYSEYLAQVGVGSKPTDFRKNCQLNLRVHVPQGFTPRARRDRAAARQLLLPGSLADRVLEPPVPRSVQRRLADDRHSRRSRTGVRTLWRGAPLQHQHRAPRERRQLEPEDNDQLLRDGLH